MESVMGMGGNQPQNSPNPTTPPGSAFGETLTASIPKPQPSQAAPAQAMPQEQQPMQAAPTETPSPSIMDFSQGKTPGQMQSSKEDQEVDDLVATLANDRKDKRIDAALKKSQDNEDLEIDNLINGIVGKPTKQSPEGLFGPRREGEGNWEYFAKNLPQGLKYVGAQMRSHLGRDPVEQRQAFESMYGSDNVKVQGGKLMFRPDPSEGFRKVDQTLFNGIVDFALYNSLNAIPLTANAVVTGATAAASSPVLTPAGGLAAGLAAGGAADAITRNALIGGINTVSDMPQDSKKVELKNEILKDAGFNLAGGVVASAVTKLPVVKQSLKKLSDSFISTGEKVLEQSGDKLSKLANVKVALNEFHSAFFPSVSSPKAAGEAVNTAIEMTERQLANNISAIKNEALVLSKKRGDMPNMDNTIGRLEKILTDNGYIFDEYGLAKVNEAVDRSLQPQGYQSALDTLASYNNRLRSEALGDGGTKLESLFQDLDNLAKQAKYDQGNPINSDIRNMFKQVRNSATGDRDAYLNKIFKDSDSPFAESYKAGYQNYASKIDSIGDFKAMFHSPQDREMMVTTLSKAPTPDKIDMLDKIKSLVGPDSVEWNGLRGEVVSNIFNQRTKEGVLNAQDALKFINKPDNAALINRVLDKDEKVVINRMLMEAAKLDTTGVFSNTGEQAVELGAGKLIELATDAKSALKNIFKVFGNDKKAIDYLTDEGFLNLAQQTRGAEMKQRILQAMRMAGDARNKMQIVSVPTASEKAAEKFRQVYVPMLGIGGAKRLDSIVNPQMPQNAGPTQAPVQEQLMPQ